VRRIARRHPCQVDVEMRRSASLKLVAACSAGHLSSASRVKRQSGTPTDSTWTVSNWAMPKLLHSLNSLPGGRRLPKTGMPRNTQTMRRPRRCLREFCLDDKTRYL
jgi:hypothetical protein